MKVKILKSCAFSENRITNVYHEKGEIVDFEENFAKSIVNGGLAVFLHKGEDMNNSIVLETQAMDLSDLNHKELLKKAEQRGFKSDKRPTKPELIEFLEK